jgi:glycosyltransferase involved in cell wall biosynthesis
MNMTERELSIVIPAKNESQLLPRLLESISKQDYPELPRTKVFVADAGSTDGSAELALAFRDRIDVEVIVGGLPSVGRNAGAAQADSRYVLFIDADMELKDPTLLRRTVELASKRSFECVTTNIWCSEGSLMDHLMYIGNDFMQYVSILIFPFSTGMYMLFEKKRFLELGGFHEGALYAEDYLLSKQVKSRRFGILRGRVMTTNRRFKKMGHLKIIWMFFWTVLNSFNKQHFLRDHGYWQTY